MDNLLDRFVITRYQLDRIMFFLGIADEYMNKSNYDFRRHQIDLKNLADELKKLEKQESDTPSIGDTKTNT